MAANESTKPFVRALADVLRETDHAAVDAEGNITWSDFAKVLPTIHYETLRKIRAGERQLDMSAIEEIAHAAGVDPTYFAEYRMMEARKQFDPRPPEQGGVGFETASDNLRRYLNLDEPTRRPAPARSRRPRTA